MRDTNDPCPVGRLDDTADNPTVSATSGQWSSDTLEQDLQVLAWLQHSPQLSSDTTGLLCDALLAWAQLGQPWPGPAQPQAGPDGDHLQTLVHITQRWMSWASTQPIGTRLELALIGRTLGMAIACQRDPAALAGSQRRDLLHRQPWPANPPATDMQPFGRRL